jgi:hypothetical protein
MVYYILEVIISPIYQNFTWEKLNLEQIVETGMENDVKLIYHKGCAILKTYIYIIAQTRNIHKN